MKSWMTALLLMACTLVYARSPVPSPEVAFTVQRGDCASPEDVGDWKKVGSTWRADGSLEVSLWDTESQTYSVVDDSASVDASTPGTLRLFYRVKTTTLPPDAPVLFCEDWVKLTFVIEGVQRAPYQVTVETTQLVRQTKVEG